VRRACRGQARTRRVETALARHRLARGQRPPVAVIDTDFVLTRQVGAVLYGAGAGSAISQTRTSWQYALAAEAAW
jgi:hypothetical protein